MHSEIPQSILRKLGGLLIVALLFFSVGEAVYVQLYLINKYRSLIEDTLAEGN
jgi:hypothetical protein